MSRKKGDPNTVHTFKLTKNCRRPAPASARAKRKGGKVPITMYITPNLYDEIRAEAIATNRTMAAVALECLEAGREVE